MMRRRSGDGTTATLVVFACRLLSNLLTYTLGMKLSFVSSKKNGKRQPDGRLSQLHLHIAALYDSLRGTSYDHDEPEDSAARSDQEYVTSTINDTTTHGKYKTSSASTTASQAYWSTASQEEPGTHRRTSPPRSMTSQSLPGSGYDLETIMHMISGVPEGQGDLHDGRGTTSQVRESTGNPVSSHHKATEIPRTSYLALVKETTQAIKAVLDATHLPITGSYMERTLVPLLPRLQLLNATTLLTEEERSKNSLQLAEENEQLSFYNEAENSYALLCPWMFESSGDCDNLHLFLASSPSKTSIVYILECVEFCNSGQKHRRYWNNPQTNALGVRPSGEGVGDSQ
jgi:hypothetical protein